MDLHENMETYAPWVSTGGLTASYNIFFQFSSS